MKKVHIYFVPARAENPLTLCEKSGVVLNTNGNIRAEDLCQHCCIRLARLLSPFDPQSVSLTAELIGVPGII